MPETLENFVGGLPVSLGRIERELKALWEEGGKVATRASLMNLAVYCEGPGAMERNTALIAEITQNHACRSLLIAARPDAPESRVQAWVNAHCHVSRAGAKQVCCEQITFLLEGDARRVIPNIVFSHLDSDLPLYLWWQEPFPDPMDEQLLTWIDRLIFDSRDWKEPARQLALVCTATGNMHRRITLCDLNWGRSLRFRQAIARLFDDPASLAHVREIRSVSIVHGANYRTTALLLLSWLMTRLGWTLQRKLENGFVCSSESGDVRVDLEMREGAGVAGCTLRAGDHAWSVSRECGPDFLYVQVTQPGCAPQDHLLPAPAEGPVQLLSLELSRGSRHQLYLDALEAFSQLL